MREIQWVIKLPRRIGRTGDNLYRETKDDRPFLASRLRLFKD
jgi:hypothetical protein